MLGFILWGCSDQQSPTAISEEANTTLNKATIIKGSFDYVYSELDTYTDCVTGASMRNYGTVKANYKIVITPSGHYIETGHADYNAYGEVTLVNTSTGEEWTLQNGTNPWHWIEYNNGSFRFHYLWNEVYKSGNNVLNLHLQGFITVDKDGIVTKNIETYSCN
jgi:hypothetical protein